MRGAHAVAVIALCTGLPMLPARAQAVDSTTAFCSTAAGTYARCALRADGGWVFRGSTGDRIGVPGRLFHATKYVVGDSAVLYARQYEVNEIRAQEINAADLLVVAAALVYAHPCHRNSLTGDCNRNRFPSRPVIIIGSWLLPHIVMAAFDSRATRALSLAFWWNNGRFTR